MTGTPADRNDLANKRCHLVAIAARLMAAADDRGRNDAARTIQAGKEGAPQ
jgi:hypothetical protein